MPILDSSHYPAIRSLIDTELSPTQLPDATIGLDIYQGAAESELLDRVPDAASKTGSDEVRVKRALVYLTAARLVHSVVRATSMSVSTRDIAFARPSYDPDEKEAMLRGMAEREIAELLTPTATAPARPTMFRVGSSTRGR